MATERTIELVVNVTTTNTWTQLLEQGGAAYAVPADGSVDIRWLAITNYGANLATVEIAFSPTDTITDDERVLAPIPLTQYESLRDPDGHALPPTYAVWARAVGTTPNVTYRAYILETTP